MVSMEEKRKEADIHHQSQREERMEVGIKGEKGGDVKW